MESGDKISIVVPVYILDEELYLISLACIKRLREFGHELIIIDNCSPLDYSSVWMEYADIYVKNQFNYGNGEAWNQGYKLAHGDFIWFCDNDLLELNDGCDSYLRAALTDQTVGVSFPVTQNRDQDGWRRQLSGFCWMTRRDVMEKIGLICTDFGIANFEDTDFFMRCQKAGLALKIGEGAFVKHYSRATCDKVPEVQRIFEINKGIYERKHAGIYPSIAD